MRALGAPEAVGLSEVRRRVREALEADWLKTAEVRERLEDPKPSVQQVRNALRAEAEAGTIERVVAGIGRPHPELQAESTCRTRPRRPSPMHS